MSRGWTSCCERWTPRRTQLGILLHTALPEITWSPPQATYLPWLDCTALGGADVPHDVFLDEGRVALEPGLRFGKSGGGFVRLNFATSGAILAAAVDAMANAAAEQRRARP